VTATRDALDLSFVPAKGDAIVSAIEIVRAGSE
jgi:hypothetical protein